VVTKVWERVLSKRLDAVVEREGLRAPTQCGFRKGCGTTDALFTIQHLIHKYRAQGKHLFCIFVDFQKAFDLVDRELLLERCKRLGIQGLFMDALVALYDNVLLRVSVNGDVGPSFSTHVGTKQGSELSPLLFGLFIELLHEMLRLDTHTHDTLVPPLPTYMYQIFFMRMMLCCLLRVCLIASSCCVC
jgi:hypothetical protein